MKNGRLRYALIIFNTPLDYVKKVFNLKTAELLTAPLAAPLTIQPFNSSTIN
jgi:hypothetical protein